MEGTTPSEPVGQDTHGEGTGLTRRDLLRKGAVLGGALAWSIPTVQTIRMAPAFAAATSFDLSYIAVVVKCGDALFRGKYELNDSGGGAWAAADDRTALPCEKSSSRSWPDPNDFGVDAYTSGPPPTGFPGDSDGSASNVRFDFGNCTVVWSLSKCGQVCASGGTGQVVTYSPCPAP